MSEKEEERNTVTKRNPIHRTCALSPLEEELAPLPSKSSLTKEKKKKKKKSENRVYVSISSRREGEKEGRCSLAGSVARDHRPRSIALHRRNNPQRGSQWWVLYQVSLAGPIISSLGYARVVGCVLTTA